jgi:hypothetical protein
MTSGTGDFDVAGALTASTVTADDVSATDVTVTSTLSLAPGSCVSVPDGFTNFLVCGNNGVNVRPAADPAVGTAIFRVTDAAGDTTLRVEHANRTLVRAPNGVEIENTSGTAHTSARPGSVSIHASSSGTHTEIDGNSIEMYSSSGTASPAPVRLGTGAVVSGGSAASNTAPDDPTGLSLIENDAADKLYLADSNCTINALWVGECNNSATTQACICTCQDTDENSGNRGWYCWN